LAKNPPFGKKYAEYSVKTNYSATPNIRCR
jgi:hypothetical protein